MVNCNHIMHYALDCCCMKELYGLRSIFQSANQHSGRKLIHTVKDGNLNFKGVIFPWSMFFSQFPYICTFFIWNKAMDGLVPWMSVIVWCWRWIPWWFSFCKWVWTQFELLWFAVGVRFSIFAGLLLFIYIGTLSFVTFLIINELIL